MACEVLALEQFDKVVWESNEIEDWFSIEPMESCRMNVTMNEAMFV